MVIEFVESNLTAIIGGYVGFLSLLALISGFFKVRAPKVPEPRQAGKVDGMFIMYDEESICEYFGGEASDSAHYIQALPEELAIIVGEKRYYVEQRLDDWARSVGKSSIEPKKQSPIVTILREEPLAQYAR